jgi:MFS family permease
VIIAKDIAIIRGVSAAIFAISLSFLNIYFFERGYSMAYVGLITGISTIVGSAMRIPSGLFSDIFGPSRVLIFGIFLRGFALVMIAVFMYYNFDLIWFFPLLLLNSAGFSFLITSSNSIISLYFRELDLTRALSIVRVGVNIGFSVGPLIGGFISEFSFPLLFLISGGLSFVLLIFVIKIKNKIDGEIAKSRNLGEKISFKDVFSPILDIQFLILLLFVFFGGVIISQFLNSLPVIAKDQNFSNRQIGFFFTQNGFFVIILQIPLVKFITRFFVSGDIKIGEESINNNNINSRKISAVFLGLLLYVIAFNFFGLHQSFAWYSFCVFILTLGEIIFQTFSMDLAMNFAPRDKKGTYLGFFEFSEAIGWSVGKYFGGFVFDLFHHDPRKFWFIVSLPALPAFLLIFVFRIFTNKRNEIRN